MFILTQFRWLLSWKIDVIIPRKAAVGTHFIEYHKFMCIIYRYFSRLLHWRGVDHTICPFGREVTVWDIDKFDWYQTTTIMGNNNDVIMSAMVSQITSLTIVHSTFIQAHIKENIKALRHWPLWGEFTVTGEFPVQKASNAENVSIWWRHNDLNQNRD